MVLSEEFKICSKELRPFSFKCNTPRKESDEHSKQNNILNQENMQQIVSVDDSTKGGGKIFRRSTPYFLLGADSLNPVALIESSTEKPEHCLTPEDYSNYRNKKFVSGKSYSKHKFVENYNLLLKDAFENFVVSNFPHLWNPNLKQQVSFQLKPFHPAMFDQQYFNLSFLSQDSNFRNDNCASQTSSNENGNCLNLPKADASTKRSSQYHEVYFSKTNSSGIAEETVNDNDLKKTTQSYSSEMVPISSEIGNSDNEMEEIVEDSDYIDVYNPSLPSGSRLFKCNLCRLRFNTEIHIEIHFQLHQYFSNVKHFICNRRNCNKSFASESELAYHLGVHAPEQIQEESNLKRKLIDLKFDAIEEPFAKKRYKIPVNNTV